MKQPIIFLALFVLLAPFTASAQLPDAPVILGTGGCSPTTEICGDGIDQDCDGSDARCPGADGDWDGYNDTADCDANNRHVYPGIYVPCTASCGQGTRLCQTNGTYGTCSCTPLCEAKGSGRCYYVSRLTGNDANPGTFDQPLKSYVRFNPGNPSGQSQLILKAGDVVYFMSGLYNDTYYYDGRQHGLYIPSVRATADAPVMIKAYPGAHPVFSPQNRSIGIFLFNSSNFIFEGIEISRVYQQGLAIYESSTVEARNMWVHDIDGVDNDNVAGVYINTVNGFNLHHSMVHDNYDRTNADTGGNKTENSRNIVFFEAGNEKVSYNVIFQTPAITAQKTGSCLTYKHGMNITGATFEVNHNIMWNCWFHSIGSSTYNGNFHHNLILNSDPLMFKNLGGTTTITNNTVQYNTIVGGGAFSYIPSQAGAGRYGPFYFHHNVVVDPRNYTWDEGGILSVDTYGDNTYYQTVVSNNYLQPNNNCYYNPSRSVVFAFFMDNSSSSRNQGGLYTFPQWQGLGYDTSSYVTNPLFDANYAPQASSCAGTGRFKP